MDDCFDGFDEDMDGDCAGNEEPDLEGTSAGSNSSPWNGPEWEDWMILGPLSEDIAREKREQDRIQRELDDEDDDYWDIISNRKV